MTMYESRKETCTAGNFRDAKVVAIIENLRFDAKNSGQGSLTWRSLKSA